MTVWILCLWTATIYTVHKYESLNRRFRLLSVPLVVLSIYGILSYTVIGRVPTDKHFYVFATAYNSEFWRELFMNALLFCPLGMTLTVIAGVYSIVFAFLMSLGIEVWQYAAGTGMAQGTDVIMNTLGAAVGALPVMIGMHLSANDRNN